MTNCGFSWSRLSVDLTDIGSGCDSGFTLQLFIVRKNKNKTVKYKTSFFALIKITFNNPF